MPAAIFTGLPGTGKSSLARELASRLDGHVLSKDEIRAAAFGPRFTAYTLEQDDLVQTWMEAAALELWARHPKLWIFFDGRTFSRQYQRARLRDLCLANKQRYAFFHCTASESTVRERLQAPHPAANRDFALYKEVEAKFEDVLERPCLELSTDQPMEKTLTWALAFLRSAAGT
jgi:predicted kinase